jgi:hypothetical protein
MQLSGQLQAIVDFPLGIKAAGTHSKEDAWAQGPVWALEKK